MSDDSVPLPFPNLKLAEYAFQLQRDELSHLHAEASKALWAGIEEDGGCGTGSTRLQQAYDIAPLAT